MAHRPDIGPCLGDRDGPAALDVLETAFGFRRVIAQMADDGSLLHAEMAHGNGVVLIGRADLPRGTPGLYVVVEDMAAHHARAAEAGAHIVFPPERTEWGTERDRCTDPEGQEWTFGTDRPQTEAPDWG